MSILLFEQEREALGALEGAVGDHDLGDPGPRQRRGGQRGHRTGADDQGLLAPGPLLDVGSGGQLLQAEGDQGLPGAVDAGLGVGALADPQRLLEQVVQEPPGGVQVLGAGQRVLYLAEDLPLADHHRVKPAGHREQVVDGPVLVVHVEVGGQLLQADAAVPGEQRGQLGDTGVELVHVGVQLDAVAGGQDRGPRRPVRRRPCPGAA
ncbi:hypothetical protein RKD37_004279 [Streptomyces ambofaciens]